MCKESLGRGGGVKAKRLYSVNQQVCCNQWSAREHTVTFINKHAKLQLGSKEFSVLNTVNDLQVTDRLNIRGFFFFCLRTNCPLQ